MAGGMGMGKESREAHLSSETWNPPDLRGRLSELRRRIEALKAFDVKMVVERHDKQIRALTEDVNGALANIFGTNTTAYWQHAVSSLDTLPTLMGSSRYPIDKVRDVYQTGINDAVAKLNALTVTLEEKLGTMEGNEPMEKDPEVRRPTVVKSVENTASRVFIIHGQNGVERKTVAGLKSRLDLEPVILHDGDNDDNGTVIERLERRGPDDFAVFLLSIDDLRQPPMGSDGGQSGRFQNILLDLGFFLGALGKERVRVLHKEDIGPALRYYGIGSIPLDDSDVWELLLAREMKRAGVEIDMNKIV